MACDKCQNGWITTIRRLKSGQEVSGTERCSCSVVAPPQTDDRPPTHEDVIKAVARLAQIPFLAVDELGKKFLAEELKRFVSTRHQLAWLASMAVAKLNRASIANLRGLFCTEFQPRDGIVTGCTDDEGKPLAGMTQWDLEAAAEQRFIRGETAVRESEAAQIAAAVDSTKLLGPGGPGDFVMTAPLPAEVHAGVKGSPMLRPTTDDWRAARAFEERINPRAPAEELPGIGGSPESRPEREERAQVPPSKPPSREDQKALEREPWYQEYQRITGRRSG